jgi:regulator of sigma E protease
MLVSIFSAVAIFATLIIIHEAGHFAMAKKLGVRVLRFSVGYPPRIWGIRRGETDYSIGATPLGGYVRMLGDEVAEEPSSATIEGYLKELKLDILGAAAKTGWLARSGKKGDEAVEAIAAELYRPTGNDANGAGRRTGTDDLAAPTPAAASVADTARALAVLGREPKADEAILLREIESTGTVKLAVERLAANKPSALIQIYQARAFPSQPLVKRIAIVLAGPFSNIIFAPLLLTVVFMTGVPMTLPVIGTVKPDLPGHAAGLRSGDDIIQLNGTAIETFDELSEAVKGSKGQPLELKVRRLVNGKLGTLDVRVTPKRMEEPTIFGTKARTWVMGVTPRGDESVRRFGPTSAFEQAMSQTGHLTVALFVGIGRIVDGTTPARQALGGPIMIAQLAGREARQGFAYVGLFMVMLSLELGIINLLPVPLLDGGHLLFFVIEGVRGKPLKLRHREIAMEVGLFLLVILMAFVILNDISRIIG